MNSNNYHFEGQVRWFEIQVAQATNGQKNGSAEESRSDLFEILQVNRILQQDFTFLQIPLP